MAQNYVRTLRQTHQTFTTLMPVVTAGLAVMGAVLATAEQRRSSGEPRTVSVLTPNAANPREARVSLIGVLAILVARACRLALAALVAAGIVALWVNSDKTTRAIIVTVLILASFYLAERVARRAQRRG